LFWPQAPPVVVQVRYGTGTVPYRTYLYDFVRFRTVPYGSYRTVPYRTGALCSRSLAVFLAS